MILHEYTPEWETEFTLLREVYLECLGDSAITIEHVGSTSIPGIKAKPIIDIDMLVNWQVWDTPTMEIREFFIGKPLSGWMNSRRTLSRNDAGLIITFMSAPSLVKS